MFEGQVGPQNSLMIPRGIPGLQAMSLDMTVIYEAERRLSEVKTVSPATAPELIGYFNESCNLSYDMSVISPLL